MEGLRAKRGGLSQARRLGSSTGRPGSDLNKWKGLGWVQRIVTRKISLSLFLIAFATSRLCDRPWFAEMQETTTKDTKSTKNLSDSNPFNGR